MFELSKLISLTETAAIECLCIYRPSLVMTLEMSNHVGGTSVTNDYLLWLWNLLDQILRIAPRHLV